MAEVNTRLQCEYYIVDLLTLIEDEAQCFGNTALLARCGELR